MDSMAINYINLNIKMEINYEWTALINIEDDEINEIEDLQKQFVEYNSVNSCGNNLLMYYLHEREFHSTKITKYLSLFCDVNSQNNDWDFALIYYLRYTLEPHVDIINMLLTKENINLGDYMGMNPIMVYLETVSSHAESNILKLLFNDDTIIKQDKYGRNALMIYFFSIEANEYLIFIKIIKYLVNDISITQIDDCGKNALNYYISVHNNYDDEEIFRLLSNNL
jgi:hypothetical protein